MSTLLYQIICPSETWQSYTSPLNNDEKLISGSTNGRVSMRSNNFKYKLVFKDNDEGNLVLRQVNKNTGAIWETNTGGHGTGKLK